MSKEAKLKRRTGRPPRTGLARPFYVKFSMEAFIKIRTMANDDRLTITGILEKLAGEEWGRRETARGRTA